MESSPNNLCNIICLVGCILWHINPVGHLKPNPTFMYLPNP